MLQTLNKNKRGGFTLVEIMIVVAIIALLSAIAVPNFLRARQRSQATRVLEDLRIVESARDQWLLEKNKTAASTPTKADLTPYFKTGSALASGTGANLVDSIGSDITVTGANVTVSQTTIDEFSDLYETQDEAGELKFWGTYHPSAAPTPTP
jgi:prepilin-type N-terminal cleavage/methylation domain-containing protein